MKSLGEALNDWRAATKGMEKLTADLPRIIGAEGVKFVKSNFKMQGYQTGAGTLKWPKRSPVTDAYYDSRKGHKGSVYNSESPILQQTMNLYNALKYQVMNSKVFIGVDATLIPYAEKMNEGGPGTWGKNKTNTPARQYLPKDTDPPNAILMRNILIKVNSERDRALNKFIK